MTNYKALRGADSSCSLSVSKQGYAASSHSPNHCQSTVGDRLSFDPLKQPIRQSVIAWASFERGYEPGTYLRHRSCELGEYTCWVRFEYLERLRMMEEDLSKTSLDPMVPTSALFNSTFLAEQVYSQSNDPKSSPHYLCHKTIKALDIVES